MMDKQGVSLDMAPSAWTTLRVAHMPKPPTQLDHMGTAYGLTRFACQSPFFKIL